MHAASVNPEPGSNSRKFCIYTGFHRNISLLHLQACLASISLSFFRSFASPSILCSKELYEFPCSFPSRLPPYKASHFALVVQFSRTDCRPLFGTALSLYYTPLPL